MQKANVGGQALIEGLLMIGPKNVAIAIRKSNNEIVIDKKILPKKIFLSKVPIFRGIINLYRQMIIGIKALMYSADFVEIEDNIQDKPSKVENFLEKVFGSKLKDIAIYFSVCISIVFSIGLFVILPNFITQLFAFSKYQNTGVIFNNIIEGLIRITLFISYLALMTKMKDIKRIWEYHGAEHKTIHCYEHDEEITIENVKKYSIKHPRCGTSFLFLVMIISILAFSLTGWHGVLLNALIRILLVPLIIGVSYELIKLAEKSNSKILKIIQWPGLMLQNFTTNEPDESQIEVAIAALKNVIEEPSKNRIEEIA